MARSDLLISLVRAGAAGDRAALKSAAEALVADERAKNHNILADRIESALAAVPVTPSLLTAASGGGGKDAILEVQPRTRLSDMLLPLPAQQHGMQVVEEHLRADVLRMHGYEPRHRILLSGPPGNGKTSFAEALAEAMALPFFTVRYDALVGSFLGETNTRLRKLFDYVRTRPSVLFFDEFDALGKERGDTHETGEIKRVVSFLLMQIDQLPSYVVVVAATNHAELLDRAVWRRFQVRLSFPAPTAKQLETFVTKQIDRWPDRPKSSSSQIVNALGLVSYAEALDFCQNVRRRHILGLGNLAIEAALSAELELWSSRVQPESADAQRSQQTASKARARPARGKTSGKTKSSTSS